MNESGTEGSPLDVATLQLIGQRTANHPLVDAWTFRPDALSPRELRLDIDVGQYPPAVSAVRIDAKWYENGDYSFQYVETRPEEFWQCRWDRHPKPRTPGAHFHPPPSADAVKPSPITDTHPLGVVFSILGWIDARLADLYED